MLKFRVSRYARVVTFHRGVAVAVDVFFFDPQWRVAPSHSALRVSTLLLVRLFLVFSCVTVMDGYKLLQSIVRVSLGVVSRHFCVR